MDAGDSQSDLCIMKSLLLVLVCSSIIYADEERLVRCKRPLQCDPAIQCAEFEKDHNGCPTCKCAKGPELLCEMMGVRGCPDGKVCQMVQNKPKCVDACPQVMCGMHCAYGVRKDDMGCDICECKTTPCDGYKCPRGHMCKSQDCKTLDCSLLPKCVIDNSPGTIPPMPCPVPMCAHYCRYGYRLNEHDCQTCLCRDTPCDTERCPENEMCVERQPKHCKGPRCVKEPLCVGKPLCSRQEELRKLALSIFQSPGPVKMNPRHRRAVLPILECDKKGLFKPRQCDKLEAICWCVDDRGVEIDGTRHPMSLKKDEPICHYNSSKGVHGTFKLRHNLQDITPHMNSIKELAHQHLSNWLHMEQEYVIIVEIMPHDTHIIVVKFEVIWDEQTELATAVYHVQYLMIQRRCQIPYQGTALTPDAQSLEVHHHYEPQLPNESGWTGEHYHHRHDFMEFVHIHQTGIVTALLGVTMLILVLAVVCSVARRRRLTAAFKHRRMDTYKENLAFSNQLYGKQQLMAEDIKEPLPDVQAIPDAEKSEVLA